MLDFPQAWPSANPPGWFADPWNVEPWRWWDGHSWTANTHAGAATKPRLPSWLSVPVAVSALLAIPIVLLLAFLAPFSLPLGLVPIFIVAPVLWWLDRVEPEPLASRIHAFLWGGFVAGTVSALVNTVVAITLSPTWAAVASAPTVEEAMKGLGVLWAVRRKEIDGVMDGIVYAGWVALGFAVVEDISYFATAQGEGLGVLAATFIVRALITPFAHPLFTAWIGLAIGTAVARNKPVALYGAGGWVVAAAFHAMWNGSLAIGASSDSAAIVLLLAAGMFLVVFLCAAVAVATLRRREQERFVALVPFLAQRYSLPHHEVSVFGNWRTMLAARKALTKPQRRMFDDVHTALARLAVLHSNPAELNPIDEERLHKQLQQARFGGG